MLALGTVVYLKGGTKPLMVLARGTIVEQNEQNVYFDYASCAVPEGLDVENVYYFNDSDVDKVIHKGYVSDDEARLEEVFEKWHSENKGEILKHQGNVESAADSKKA
ncbi:DUF4176 domain-containing protein [Furfurilactobacillus entadae]|uniref:DUF4176 domain-containing protein n=1 Tax=Furfurilactobacillus entadae TaxID=2922307 RepID=UPI0035EFB5DD